MSRLFRIAARVAAMSQPLSERPDYGTDSNPSLPRGCECQGGCQGECGECQGECGECQLEPTAPTA